MLPETTVKRIEADAEKLLNTIIISNQNWPTQVAKNALIKYLTAEATRSLVLLEAAKEILHLHLCEQEGLLSGRPTWQQWFDAVNKLSEAISSYNNQTNR